MTRRLRIVELFPGALFPQGDGGNVLGLAWRARRRGIEVEAEAIALGAPIPPADLYAVGGGEDEDAPVIAARLRADETLRQAVMDGAVLFGSGQGYELLGSTFERYDTGDQAAGAGFLDATFTRGDFVDRRVVTRPNATLGLAPLSGYESHRGRAVLGPDAAPLAEIEIGTGNGGDPPTDGAVGTVGEGRVVGTWLHGPVVPRNSDLADLLLAWALRIEPAELEPLGDGESRFAELVRSERIAEAHHYASELTPR
jgi:lipid II isoglutaminyl synthase (glutamine-hydrolysing)